MGCTSSKPKRTTSIEDVGAASKQPQPAPDKNGQVTKAPEKPLLREKDPKSETNAIEIPGAHKSFMAPDGIPFIDEDVESELDEVPQPTTTVGVSVNDSRKHGGGSSPDQNKNVAIVVNKEVKVVTSSASAAAPSTKSSALKENAPLPPTRDESTRREADVVVVRSGGEPVVISDIKIKEVQITTTKSQETGDSSETSDRRTLTDNKAKTDEELAATKIQAGIRGYLDRQKVKAIRGNIQHHPTEGEDGGDHKDSTQEHAGPKVTEHVVVETTEFTIDDPQPHDPKLDAAATKIQANYKGYKTRKVIKTTTTTTTHSN